MAQYQILYWNDIPAQVKAHEAGGRPVSRRLPERFQIEIDRVAIEEGLTGTDAYLEQWHWTPRQVREGTAQEVADALVEELSSLRPR